MPEYGRRGSGAGRLLIAIAIAAFGFISYLSKTQVNPVTGEKQRVAMDVDQERALGLQSASQMAREMGGAIDPRRDPDARLVAELGEKLVQRSNASRSPYADNFSFNLLNDPETVNAFALPGGPIFITRGLYRRLGNEAQLAGVLGHEIGHVIHRHAAEHMAKGQLGQLLTVAVGVGTDDGQGSGNRARMIAAMVNQVVQLKYGRGDESESDHYGLVAMADTGYDPTAMLEVMRVLKAVSGGQRQPEFLSSHPLPETRLQEIEEYLTATYPGGVPSNLGKGRSLEGRAF